MDVISYCYGVLAANLSASQLRTLYSTTRFIHNTVLSAINSLQQSPSLGSIVLLLIVLLLSMHILNMLLNMIRFWIRLASRILFWGSIVGAGAYLYLRGPEAAINDVQYWTSYWLDQYQEFSDKAAAQKSFERQRAYGRGNTFGIW